MRSRGPSIAPSSMAARNPASAPPQSRAVVTPQAKRLPKNLGRLQNIVGRRIEQMLAHVTRAIGAVHVAIDMPGSTVQPAASRRSAAGGSAMDRAGPRRRCVRLDQYHSIRDRVRPRSIEDPRADHGYGHRDSSPDARPECRVAANGLASACDAVSMIYKTRARWNALCRESANTKSRKYQRGYRELETPRRRPLDAGAIWKIVV